MVILITNSNKTILLQSTKQKKKAIIFRFTWNMSSHMTRSSISHITFDKQRVRDKSSPNSILKKRGGFFHIMLNANMWNFLIENLSTGQRNA